MTITDKLDRAAASTMTNTAFVTLALTCVAHKVYTSSKIGFYLSKKKAKASGMTVMSVGKDASNYIKTHYKKNYKKL
ncbi:hypothetical protein [uncultured Mediterranean phage uvMED]|nr:hypothetical protein [uncultured Mediterranean phage uvMED]BAQ87026.1 hypothetical protein [uncultured Mediterranean phage uvMED]BAR16610.1 hypothetical protein [uncultured Mediterranean phage uvMED]BAR16663.1 hypothetical protein [uncultured Mediterranean phage uvMED]